VYSLSLTRPVNVSDVVAGSEVPATAVGRSGILMTPERRGNLPFKNAGLNSAIIGGVGQPTFVTQRSMASGSYRVRQS